MWNKTNYISHTLCCFNFIGELQINFNGRKGSKIKLAEKLRVGNLISDQLLKGGTETYHKIQMTEKVTLVG